MCLSTCNRTELYLAGLDGEAAESAAVALLADLSGLDPGVLNPALYRLRGEAAALHLFRVAAGLDSLVPGEAEILGQVRARSRPAHRPVLDRLFRQALHAGKKARTETAIGESPASVSSAAAALASRCSATCQRRQCCSWAPEGRGARRPQPRLARRPDRVRREPQQ